MHARIASRLLLWAHIGPYSEVGGIRIEAKQMVAMSSREAAKLAIRSDVERLSAEFRLAVHALGEGNESRWDRELHGHSPAAFPRVSSRSLTRDILPTASL